MKKIFPLLLVLALAGCSSAPAPKSPSTVPVELPPVVVETTKPEAPAEPVKVEPPVVVPGGSKTEVIETVKTQEGPIKIEVVPTQEIKQQTFSVRSSLTWMKDVAAVAECVIHNEDFLKEVAGSKQFFDTKHSSQKVAENMRRYRPAILTTYKTKNPYSSTIAYRNVGSNVLYFNLWQNPRLMKYMVNTAVHEWLHVQDYGHTVNYTSNRPFSVPYKVGDMAEKYVAGCNKTKTK